jgi:hypothetical protein
MTHIDSTKEHVNREKDRERER